MSPMLSKGIGMAYINAENAALGNEIFIEIRNKKIKGQIVKMPFIKL